MARTVFCVCGTRLEGATGEQLLTAVERHAADHHGAPRVADLTPTERRVADLVAAGRRNKDVAAELGLAVKTVETHLTRSYRKLGIRSRAELAAVRRNP